MARLSTQRRKALELPEKLGIEDATRRVEKWTTIVRFSIVDLIANLYVLGPVPHDIREERLILS